MAQLKRIFVVEDKEIEDLYPSFTPDQAKKMMIEDYPNILNAAWTQVMDEVKGVLKIIFSSQVIGTRG